MMEKEQLLNSSERSFPKKKKPRERQTSMLPSHEEYISSLFKFEPFLNEGKYQHFWDLHWLQRSFWTTELPKECISLSLFPNPIPIYCTELPSQSWPAWEVWRGVKILADTSRNQMPHCRMTHATENTDVQDANLGQDEQSRWAQMQHLEACTCWVWCTGLCNLCVLGERTQGSVLWLLSPVAVTHCLLAWRRSSTCLR